MLGPVLTFFDLRGFPLHSVVWCFRKRVESYGSLYGADCMLVDGLDLPLVFPIRRPVYINDQCPILLELHSRHQSPGHRHHCCPLLQNPLRHPSRTTWSSSMRHLTAPMWAWKQEIPNLGGPESCGQGALPGIQEVHFRSKKSLENPFLSRAIRRNQSIRTCDACAGVHKGTKSRAAHSIVFAVIIPHEKSSS